MTQPNDKPMHGAELPRRHRNYNPELLVGQFAGSNVTLRDVFAGMAMQAMITKSTGQDTTGGKKGVPLIAGYAYQYADAMLDRREKDLPPEPTEETPF